MDLRAISDYNQRREALESNQGVSLKYVGTSLQDSVESIHCENLIGAITIPLGVAGPLHIKGDVVEDTQVYIPLATTEGALVASVSRGCKTITACGGAVIQTELIGTTRGPVFQTNGLTQSRALSEWINEHIHTLNDVAKTTSSHISLLKATCAINGNYVYVRFHFDTQDAMGMNMVTIATEALSNRIKKETGATCIALAGNYDIDKKAAWLNMIEGRGRKGWGEVIVSKEVLEKNLKTTPEKLERVVLKKCWGGSMLSGSLGFNAHFSNIIAAFFAATGQDLAHVVEGSQGITSAEVLENGDLYFSVYLPSIMIGTVGGGTKLATQSEARSITKAKTGDELCEIVIGAVLAGELSLLASLSESTLASAHKKLGR